MKKTMIRGIVFTIAYMAVIIGVSMLLYTLDLPYLKAGIVNENIFVVFAGALLFGLIEKKIREKEEA